MEYMLTIIVIVLLFASLVLLHEYGHFVVARRNGVDVEEFGFGFPPKLFGRKHKGVLYSVNLLPLGGFVRLKGEDANDMSEGSFAAASLSVKAKILMAGVGMNLLTSFIIFYALSVTGLPGLGKQFEPSFLTPSFAQNKQLILSNVEKSSPADQAGLKRGDYVLAFGGKDISTDTQLRDLTKANAGRQVALKVKQGDVIKDINVTLRPASAKNGFLGVASQQVYKLRYDPLQAVVAAAYVTIALLVATIVGVIQLLLALPALIFGLFSPSVPAAAAAASGPVGIVFILNSISSLGWAYVLLFMANISVALAAFNALPLPALDGGRLFVSVLQRATGRKWNPETEAKFHAIGFIALIGLMVLISVYDVRKYF